MEPSETSPAHFLIERAEAKEIVDALGVTLVDAAMRDVFPHRRLQRSLTELRHSGAISDGEWELLGELARPDVSYAEAGAAVGRHGHHVIRTYGEIADTVRFRLSIAEDDPDNWILPIRPVTDD